MESFQPEKAHAACSAMSPGISLSPAVRELVSDLEAHLRAVAEEFDRARS